MVSLTGTSQLIAIPIIPYVFVTRENLFKEISNERCPFNTAYAKTTPSYVSSSQSKSDDSDRQLRNNFW